jgi:hypothetical protein
VRRRLAIAALAVNGVLLGHGLAYLVSATDPAGRQELLAGHGHLPLLALVAVPAGVVAVVWLGRQRSGAVRLPVRTLAVAQLLTFFAMETAERFAGAGAHAALAAGREPVVLVGLAIQPLVAVGLALLGHRVATWSPPALLPPSWCRPLPALATVPVPTSRRLVRAPAHRAGSRAPPRHPVR